MKKKKQKTEGNAALYVIIFVAAILLIMLPLRKEINQNLADNLCLDIGYETAIDTPEGLLCCNETEIMGLKADKCTPYNYTLSSRG